MDEIFPAGETNDEFSIERCRELLGDESIGMCDDEVDRIRHCAVTVAQAVIEMFLDEKRPTIHWRMRTNLRSPQGGYAAGHGRRGDLCARQHKEQTENLSLPMQLQWPSLCQTSRCASASPCHAAARQPPRWLAEPKLTLRVRKRERRLVDLIAPRWKQLAAWLTSFGRLCAARPGQLSVESLLL
jgi:hypothetical protein